MAIFLRRFSYLYRQFGEHSVSDNVVVSTSGLYRSQSEPLRSDMEVSTSGFTLSASQYIDLTLTSLSMSMPERIIPAFGPESLVPGT